MSLIDELSVQTPLPSLELFAVPPTQTSIERDIVREVRPLSTISSTHPIELIATTVNDEYINPSECYFFLKFKTDIARTDKAALSNSDWDDVTPVNNLLHSMFEQVEVSVGDTQINLALGTYAYRAYLDTIIEYDSSARKSYLSSCGWIEDDAERRKLIKYDGMTSQKEKKLHFVENFILIWVFRNAYWLAGVN